MTQVKAKLDRKAEKPMTATRKMFELSFEEYLEQSPKAKIFLESNKTLDFAKQRDFQPLMSNEKFCKILNSFESGLTRRISSRYQYQGNLSLLEWEALFTAAQRLIDQEGQEADCSC